MSMKTKLWCVMALILAAAGCTRDPDPMSLVQSEAEYACFEAVEDEAGTAGLTLLALRKIGAASDVLIREDRSGQVWRCATDGEDEVVTVAAVAL